MGAYCNAFQNGHMVLGCFNTGTKSVSSGKVRAHADEFRSVHNVLNNGNVKKSRKFYCMFPLRSLTK